MHNIILTESELKELKYLIAETKEFKSTTITNPIIQLGYSEEEYRLINKFLKPIFEKIGMYK